jgi:guanylate kinase
MSSKTRRGVLFVVSGPSGVGKTTLCQRLVAEMPDVTQSVSYTTRTQRAGEQQGREYHFTSRDDFERRIAAGEFLEWARIHDHLYGTSRQQVERLTESGLDVLLAIDVQGAAQLRRIDVGAVLVFVLPPSWAALAQRMRQRDSEPAEERQRRLAVARQELAQYTEYDYAVINDRLPAAVEILETIILAERHRVSRMCPSPVEKLLAEAAPYDLRQQTGTR